MKSVRSLRTILFTDIVGSTREAAKVGDHRWREILRRHDEIVRRELDRFGGREVKTTGDGFLAIFDGSGRAIRCAWAIRDAVAEEGLEIRCGLHLGKVEHHGDDVAGIGVHVGARVASLAEPGEVVVSSTVREAETGSAFAFEPRGSHELKGVPGEWRLFAVTEVPDAPQAEAERRWPSSLPRRAVAVIVAVLVLGSAFGLARWLGGDGSGTGSEAGLASIAVLPLENLSAREENEVFVGGMHKALLTQLAKVGDLKVISHFSVQAYAGTEKSVQEIGEDLGVRTVLEGSVQRAGDRIRVTVQLIDAETGENLWAEQFDRQMTHVFEIQTELALAVTRRLEARLTAKERGRLETRPTNDPEAYTHYLRAVEHFPDHPSGDQLEEQLRTAETLFERALSRDPEFSLARARLASVRLHRYWFFGRPDTVLGAARASAERALELDPDLPEAHLAMGLYHYWGHRDYDAALRELEIARGGMPGDPFISVIAGSIHKRQGRWDEAIAAYRRAIELDPLDPRAYSELGTVFRVTYRFEEALEAWSRLLELAPDAHNVRIDIARMRYELRGEVDSYRHVVDSLPDHALQEGRILVSRAEARWLERDFEDAIRVLRGYEPGDGGTGPITSSRWTAVFLDRRMLRIPLATLHRWNGEVERARALYDSTIDEIEAHVRDGPDQAGWHRYLAQSYAGSGRAGEAVRNARRAVELIPLERGYLEGMNSLVNLTAVYVLLERSDEAIRVLDRIVGEPAAPTSHELRIDPVWDPLRRHPDFERILEKARP